MNQMFNPKESKGWSEIIPSLEEYMKIEYNGYSNPSTKIVIETNRQNKKNYNLIAYQNTLQRNITPIRESQTNTLLLV